MLVSHTIYTLFIGTIVACALIPFLYFLIKEKRRVYWSLIILLLIIPIDMNTPPILTVNSCGSYSKEVMMFPTDGFERGYHGYIVNNSDQHLFLETIIYSEDGSEPQIDEEKLIFKSIEPGTSYKTTFGGSVDYIFEEAPETIEVKKGEVSIRYSLSCYNPEDWEGDWAEEELKEELSPEVTIEE